MDQSSKENTRLGISCTEDKKIILKANYSWAICLNANYDGKLKNYCLSLTSLNLEKLKKISIDCGGLSVSKFPKSSSDLKLRPYQAEDVSLLSQKKRIAIFNEMRTGKTPTALAVFQNWSVDNLLIICPGILQTQWQEAAERWLDKPAYIISYLSASERQNIYKSFCQEKNWIVIISKDIFKIDAKQFKEIRKKKKPYFCSIVDEAHFLRNYQSQQSKSIYTLKDSEHKMVLTGTPIVNHSMDIFGILKFLQPDVYTSYWKFAEEYFFISQKEFKKTTKGKTQIFQFRKVLGFKSEKKQNELQNFLSQFSVSRKQKDVLPWLPLIDYKEEKLLMTEQQQTVYSRWTQKWDKNYPLEFLAKLKTLTLYPPALLKGEGNNFLTSEDEKLLRECAGTKIDYLVDFCLESKGQSILVFSTRTETFLEPLAKFLTEAGCEKIGLITGKVSPGQKKDFISDFQQKKLQILLCNIQSAGMGLNLSQADVVVFADRSYSPADNEQAEARFLPTQSTESRKARIVIDLICKGAIDEKILRLLKRKKDITKIINLNPEYLLD